MVVLTLKLCFSNNSTKLHNKNYFILPHFNINNILSDFCCFTIDDVLNYLGNFNFIKNCVVNYLFTIFI